MFNGSNKRFKNCEFSIQCNPKGHKKKGHTVEPKLHDILSSDSWFFIHVTKVSYLSISTGRKVM